MTAMISVNNSVLHVDLTGEETDDIQISRDEKLQYPGGKGHAIKPFYDHIKPGIDPLREDNIPVFMTGLTAAVTSPAGIRFTVVTYKLPMLEFMTGLGLLAAEADGVQRASRVRERIVNMINYTESVKAPAAMNSPEKPVAPGLFVPNRLMSSMAKLFFASDFHEFVRVSKASPGAPGYPDDVPGPDQRGPQALSGMVHGGAGGFDAEGRSARACFEGDVEGGTLYCGQIAGYIREILPEREVIERTVREAEEIVGMLQAARDRNPM